MRLWSGPKKAEIAGELFAAKRYHESARGCDRDLRASLRTSEGRAHCSQMARRDPREAALSRGQILSLRHLRRIFSRQLLITRLLFSLSLSLALVAIERFESEER